VAKLIGDARYDSEKHESLPAYRAGLVRIDREHPLATLDDYLDHIAHAVKVAGIDHVGLASDFDGGGGITGWMDATETGNVTAGLRRRGFDQAAIAKLWSGNLLRVWRDVESVARQTPPAGAAGPAAKSNGAAATCISTSGTTPSRRGCCLRREHIEYATDRSVAPDPERP